MQASNTSKLLHTIDRIKPDMKPLAPHFAATQDTHTRELYATMLAAVLLSNQLISEAESRLFAMLLQSLGLESQSAKFLAQAQQLNAEQLRDFFRILNTDDLKSAFLMDAMILSRIDSPISDAQSQLLAEFLDVFELEQSKLYMLMSMVSLVVGLPYDLRRNAQKVKFIRPNELAKLDSLVEEIYVEPYHFVNSQSQILKVRVKDQVKDQVGVGGIIRAIALANLGVSGFSIRSPISGMLLDVPVKVGDVLSPNQIVAYVLPIPPYVVAWTEFLTQGEDSVQSKSHQDEQSNINEPELNDVKTIGDLIKSAQTAARSR